MVVQAQELEIFYLFDAPNHFQTVIEVIMKHIGLSISEAKKIIF